MINIKIWKDGKPHSTSINPNETLHRILVNQGILLPAPCGGNGTCRKCIVSTSEGDVLSCQTYATNDMEIYQPSKDESMAILDAYESNRSFCFDRSLKTGIAIDIGTTTIAFELIDYTTGISVTHSTANSQRALGADVVTRIKKANEGALLELHSCILEDIRLGLEFFADHKIDAICIAGNTTMLHLLQNLSCETLGVFPFTPVDIKIKKYLFENIPTTLLPGISTFVGADVAAGMLCCYTPEPSLLIDLGTNGEMALFSQEKILVTSTAAGPAFEAGNISCGVASIPGAIAQIRYLPETNVFIYETIDNAPPIGICGTGVVGIAAELVKHGLVDETGRLEDPYFDSGVEIAPGITFTQKDMREIQLAKSALRSGVEILLEMAGYGYNDIAKVYLAGGFGYRMDLESAVILGLIPKELEGNVITAGNTSLGGTTHVLTSRQAEEEILALVARAEEINLSAHPRFNDLFMEHMMFE